MATKRGRRAAADVLLPLKEKYLKAFAAVRDSNDLAPLRALTASQAGSGGAAGGGINAAVDEAGNTALHLAAGFGELGAVRFLVRKCGADPNAARSSDGQPPMHVLRSTDDMLRLQASSALPRDH